MKVRGAIASIESQPRTTKYGNRLVHYIHVNGERYQLGFGKVEAKMGDTVEFESGDKGYGPEVNKGSLVVVASAAPAAAVAVPAGASPAPAVDAPAVHAPKSSKQAGVFPIPALSGERAIIRQNALTQARELVVGHNRNLALQKGTGVELPTYDMQATEIVRLARKYFETYSAGDTDMAEAKAEVEKK